MLKKKTNEGDRDVGFDQDFNKVQIKETYRRGKRQKEVRRNL